MISEKILRDIVKERIRQEELKESGKFKFTLQDSDDHISPCEKLAVLAEEFGEISRVVTEYILRYHKSTNRYAERELTVHEQRHLREELIQVAACCAAWIESIDRRMTS